MAIPPQTEQSPGGEDISTMLADDASALTPAPIEEIDSAPMPGDSDDESKAGPLDPAVGAPPPSPVMQGAVEPEPIRLASAGSFFSKGAKAVKAAAPAVQAARVVPLAERLLAETIQIGEKTIKLDLSPLGADAGAVDTLINAVAKEYRSVLVEAKRGKISDAKLKKLAANVGMSEEKVLELVQGDTLNAEQMLAANQVMAAVGRRVLATRDEIKLAGAGNDPAARKFMAEQLAALLEVEARTRGAASELGRALRANQVPVEGLGAAKQAASQVRQIGDPTGAGLDRALGMLDHIKTPQQASIFARLWNTVPDAFIEVWINSLLSGPATHVANLAGNSLAAANGVLERMVAGGFGKIKRGNDKVYLGEPVQMLMAAVDSLGDAFRAGAKTFRSGEVTFGQTATKLDYTDNAISSANLELSGVLGYAADGIGTAVNIPKRALMGEDEFFKAINFQMDLRARAYRMAKMEGLSGKKLRDRMSTIMTDPETFAEAHEASKGYARYVTFSRELGPMGSALRDWSNAHVMTKMIAPFITAPVNLAHYSFERYPALNLAMGSVRADLFGKNGGVARDLAMAKVSVGLGAAALVGKMVFSGYITGRGPLNPHLKATKQQTGWQPYSIYDPITEQYVSYERTDPLGMFIASVADVVQIAAHAPEHEYKTLAAAVGIGLGGVMLNKTYLRGFAGLVEALEATRTGDVEGGGIQHWMNSYAGTLVPAAVAQYTRATDPVVRDVRGSLDAIYARLPGYAKDVPPKRDLYGRPVLREGGWGPDLASPFYTKTLKEEPGLMAILENQIPVMPLSRTLVGAEENDIEVDPARAAKQPGVALTPKEYDRWGELVGEVRLGGKTLKESLDALVEKPRFQKQSKGPDGGQALEIKAKILVYRQKAKDKLFREHPEILDRMEKYYKDKGERLRPSRAVEAEPGSSVDAGTPDISSGIGRLTR